MPYDRHLDFMRLLSRCGFPCAFPRDPCVLCGCLCHPRQHLKDSVQQIVNAASMLSGNREHIPHPEHMKLVEQSILPVRVHLVDRQKERLASACQQSRQLAIRTSDLSASIDDHDNRRRFVKRDLGLAEYLRRYEIFVVGNDAARTHHSKLVPEPLDLAVEAVARNTWLIADDGAPRSRQMIEESGFSDIRAPDDGDKGKRLFFSQSLFLLRG